MSKNTNDGIKELLSSDQQKLDSPVHSHQTVPSDSQVFPINQSIKLSADYQLEDWKASLNKTETTKACANRESFQDYNGSSDEQPPEPAVNFKKNRSPPIQKDDKQEVPEPKKLPTKTTKQKISSSSSSQSDTQINNIKKKYNHQNETSPQQDSDGDQWEDTNEFVVNRVQKSSKEYLIDDEQSNKPAPVTKVSQNNDDDAVVDIHRSMFTEDTAKKLLMPLIEKQKQIQKLKEKETIINIPTTSNFYESVYMQGGIQFQSMENKMWWKLFQDKIYIQKQTLDVLFEEFLRRNLILPLFSESQSQMEFSIQAKYIEKYTTLLNKRFPNHFKEVLEKMVKGFRKGSFELDSQCQPSPDSSEASSISFKGLYEKYLFKKLSPSLGYSKVQLTRNYFVKKLNSLKAYEESFSFITGEDYQDKVKRDEQYKSKIKQIEGEIADLEMIVSFQNTEDYCKAKSQKLEKKIWKERLGKSNELKEAWIKLRQSLSKGQIIFHV